MSAEDDGGDKEHEPTQKRLDDAREKGEIPRSPDLSTAAGYLGMLLAVMVFGGAGLKGLGQTGAVFLDQADRFAPLILSDGAAPVAGLIGAIAGAVYPVFLLPAAFVLMAILAQKAMIFTPEKIAPKFSRISPLANAKNKYGRSGLFEFGKSFAKLVIVSAILGVFLASHMNRILGTLRLSPAMATMELLTLLSEFLLLIVVLSAAIGALDYLWQRAEHLRRNRMSRKDLMDEMKQAEGDPHLKAKRRQRGHDIATNRMLAEVAIADVIVVNPMHYAVALRWDRDKGAAPICVAKGVDEIAARIRERAAESGVPIHRDPPTARAIFSTVDLGQQIRPEHYRTVAAAIRFAEAMRKKAKARR